MSQAPIVSSLSTSVMITRREDVSLKVFYDYWSDIHGVLAAKAEGAFEYFQHRLGAPIDNFFDGMNAVDQTSPEGDPIVGLAEITFLTEGDREKLIRSAAVGQMVIDEQNVLKGTYMYSTGPGNAETVVDRTKIRAPQGATGDYRVIAFLRQADQCTTADFRSYVRETLLPTMRGSPLVMKARLHLLEVFDEGAWPTPNVDHRRGASQRYNAYIELAFDSEAATTRFVRSAEMLETASKAAPFVASISTYPDFETYTMVFGGRPTQAGLRGLSAFRTLEAIREPENQRSLQLLNVMFGAAVLPPLA
jgi:hypothetical protein